MISTENLPGGPPLLPIASAASSAVPKIKRSKKSQYDAGSRISKLMMKGQQSARTLVDSMQSYTAQRSAYIQLMHLATESEPLSTHLSQTQNLTHLTDDDGGSDT